MIGALMSAWAFIGKVPYVRTIAGVGLAFFFGMAVGNYHATQRALERTAQILLDDSARRQAANHIEILKAKKEDEQRLKTEFEQQRNADRLAYNVLAEGKAEAEDAKVRALQALDAEQRRLSAERAKALNLTETNDGLKKVNEILAAEMVPASCVLSARVRRELNEYANAAPYPAPGDTEAPTAGLLDGTDPGAQALTCEQLSRGYLDLAEHDRMLTAWVLSWQAWAFEALR